MAKIKDKPGVGNLTVRLADVPLEDRLVALDETIREAKTEAEATLLLQIAVDPGDYGGRIAA